jgi:hypothetical protein
LGVRRILLWVGALAFASWELVGVLLWVGAAGSLGVARDQTWARLRSDWYLLIVVTDHLVIAGVVLLWVWGDMGRRGWSLPTRLAWLVTLIALGTPTLLAYLAERPVTREASSVTR